MKLKIATVLARIGLGSTIARNSVMLIGANILGHAINTVVSIVMRRMLGVERVGVRDWAINYSVVPSVVSEFGLTRATVLESARKPPEELPEVLGQLTATRFATSALYLVLMWSSLLLPFNREIPAVEKYLVMFWSTSLVFQSLRRNSEAAFLATEKMRYQAMLMLMNRLLSACGVLFVLYVFRNQLAAPLYSKEWYLVLYYLFLVYLAVDVIDAATGFLLVRRKIAVPRLSLDWRPKLALLIAGWPFALQMLAGQLYYFVSTPLIRYRFDVEKVRVDSEVGYFTTAYSIIMVLTQIPVNLTNALFPPMSRAFFQGDTPRLYSLFNYGLQLMIMVGMPIGVLLFLFRGELLLSIYGPGYRNSIPMLGILAWTLPFVFINSPIANLLAVTGRQKRVGWTMLAAAFFNIVFNYMAIPRWGAMASSLATLLTEFLFLLLMLAVGLRHYLAGVQWSVLGRILGFQAAAAVAFVLLDEQGVVLRLVTYSVYALVCAWGVRWLIRKRREGSV